LRPAKRIGWGNMTMLTSFRMKNCKSKSTARCLPIKTGRQSKTGKLQQLGIVIEMKLISINRVLFR
jgi:hypothetical protein